VSKRRPPMLKVEDRFMIKDLHRRGMTISEIARITGHDRKTIRAILNGPVNPPGAHCGVLILALLQKGPHARIIRPGERIRPELAKFLLILYAFSAPP
jgi:predicted transcriptional regulator